MVRDVVAGAAVQGVSDVEVLEARDYLTLTREGLVQAVSGLSDEQWRFKPAPQRWSIHEVVEHLAVVEELFHQGIAPRLWDGSGGAAVEDPHRMDALVLALEPDPGTGVVIPGRVSLGEAPPQLSPTRLEDHRDSLARFLASRERTAAFLETSLPRLRSGTVEQPALGPLDGYQWVLFMAAHSARHTKQILGVLADPRIPRRRVDIDAFRTTP